jgi:hypothetical protein
MKLTLTQQITLPVQIISYIRYLVSVPLLNGVNITQVTFTTIELTLKR